MSITTRQPVPATATDHRSRPIGGAAAVVAALTFVFGIVMFATGLSDYTTGDLSPAESVDFLVAHQGSLLVWYLGIFIVFGIALVPLALALHRRLAPATPMLAQAATTFGLIWAGLMFATGMISNIGIEVVADLAGSHPDDAPAVWSSIDAVTNGLGGGNELVGGLWIGLISVAALASGALPKALNWLGVATAVGGMATLVPGFEAAEMAFGLGSIAWFVWIGTALLRDRTA